MWYDHYHTTHSSLTEACERSHRPPRYKKQTDCDTGIDLLYVYIIHPGAQTMRIFQ